MVRRELALSEIAHPVERRIQVVPGMQYRTIGVKWWGEGAYERSTIDGAQTAARTLNLVHEDDLIINKIWVRHGSVAVAGPSVDGCAASGEFPTFELDRSAVLPAWMYWQCKLPSFWRKCAALSRGTSGKNRIRPEVFLSIRVQLLPLDEQRQIVARIEGLATKLEEARALQVEQERQEGRLLLQSYRDAIEGAAWHPMAEAAPLVRRAVRVDPHEEYREVGIRSFGKGTFHKPPVPGAELGNKRVFAIEPGDLLFNIVFAWEGAVTVAQERDAGRVGSHRFLTCVPKATLATAEFLRFHFLTSRGIDDLGAASPGGAGRNRTLGLKALAEIRVPVPSTEKQLRFNELQAKVSALHKVREEERAQWDALLPSIVAQAFAGQL